MAKLGVTINGFHTLKDWGLHWNSCQISEPVPITSYVDIPGRKTKLDATESLFGQVTYENRTLTFGFWAQTDWAEWMELSSQIQSAIAGKRCKVTLDIDLGSYWMGRASVKSEMSADNPVTSFFTITIDAEPYKYRTSNADAADDEMVSNLNDIQISGNKTISVTAKSIPCTPTVTVTADMTLVVNDQMYQLWANTPLLLEDVVLYKNSTDFIFTGTGKATISFRGESL